MTAAKKNLYRLFAILLCISYGLVSSAQLTAAFTASPSLSGCSPFIVNFNDASTGSPTQWKWDLGNGVISLLKNPSATYFNPGTYTVKLIVRNSSGADSVTKVDYLTVYPNPVVNFSADKTTGCFPLNVNFRDSTNAGTGTIASWIWDFGDGNTSTQQNPSHVYTTAGNYSITLKATNSTGCTKTFTRSNYISVSIGVKSNFTSTSPGLCPAPASVNFTNTSTGPGPLSFAWSFGDGGTSGVTNPSYTYAANGLYSVTLVTTSPQGCTDTVRKPALFSIGNIKAGFTGPDTVCVNTAITYSNTSSPAPLTNKWSFGNGTTATTTNGAVTYTIPGTYTIKLVAGYGACADSVTKQVYVSPKPQPAFTGTPNVFCALPAVATFTNLTPGSGTVLWNFGDGTSSTIDNPTHTYNAQGNFTVTLTVTNAAGCSVSLAKPGFMLIKKPVVTLSGVPKSGCAPVTLTPTAVVSSGHILTSYLWNFGDGTTSTLASPSHTYMGTGTYSVTLTYTTSGGCTGTVTVANAVKTGTKPTAAFTLTPKDACAFQSVAFTDNSSTPVTQWIWDFGDGSSSTQQNPVHQYSDTGWFNVQLIAINNTCPDTIRTMNAVHIRPPIASFTVQNSCIAKYSKKFLNSSIGAITCFWTFGDGSSSTLTSPTHVYTTAGTYNVSLTVSNDTCSNSYSQTIKVIDEKAAFTANDSIVCHNQNLTFTVQGINATNIAAWQWSFGDGATSALHPTATHSYSVSGIYNVSLAIRDLLGCTDTAYLPVRAYSPVADFSPLQPVACLLPTNLIGFTNLSTAETAHPIVKWKWSYGDGTLDSSGTLPYQHSYTATGNYTVSLMVTDNTGCTDIVTKPGAVIISQPKAAFFSLDTMVCTGKPIQFTNTTTGNNPTYSWDFGDGTTTATDNPAHNYPGIGTYSVALFATDQYGCKDSIAKPDYISIFFPKAKFTVSDSMSTCPPLLVNFYNASSDYTSLTWDFGDGASSTLTSPSHFYTKPGIYIATVTVKGPSGCTDVATQKIEIKGPSGSFVYTPVSGCKPLTVNFTASTKNNVSYTWDFADGNLTVTSDSVIAHTYSYAGDFVPKLILTDVGGCSVPITGTPINVVGIVAGFDMGPATFCANGKVQFTNTSVSNDFISGYQWNFGDGSNSTVKDPNHHYTAPGIYTVSLTVNSQFGCQDSVSILDTVKVYANPVVSISGDSAACAPAQLSYAGVVLAGNPALLTWNWSFGNGQIAAVQNPSVQAYPVAGTFTITATVTDEHNCHDTTSNILMVHETPVPAILGDSTSCTPAFMSFTGSITQGASPNLAWNWNMGNGQNYTIATPPAQGYTPGHYVITATVNNVYGCTDSTKKDINIYPTPAIDIVGDSSGCTPIVLSLSGLILQGDPADLTWSWNMGNGQIYSTQNTPVQTYSNGSYIVTAAVVTSHGCMATKSKTVNAYVIPSTTAGVDSYICRGSFGQLNASGADSYVWNADGTLSCTTCANPLADPVDSTTYIVKGITVFGCSSTDSITVRVHQPFTIQVAGTDTVCSGSTIHLRATGADQYSWTPTVAVANPTAGITTANPTTTTLYQVVAKDNFNCFADTGYVNIKVWPYPKVDAGPDKTVSIGSTLIFQPAYSNDIVSFAWTNPMQTLSCTDCPAPTVHPKGAQNTYAIKVRSDGGCVSTDEITVYTICNGGNLFIPNTFSPNKDGKNDKFYPRGSGLGTIKSLRIYDRWGEQVFTALNFTPNDASLGWDGSYKGKPLPPDVYVYTCEVVCMNNELLIYNGNVTLLK